MTPDVREAAIKDVDEFFRKAQPLFVRETAQLTLQRYERLLAGFRVELLDQQECRLFLTAEKIGPIIDLARSGDGDAQEVLDYLVQDLTQRAQLLPLELQRYLASGRPMGRPRRTQGLRRRTFAIRDYRICLAVAHVRAQYGTPATHETDGDDDADAQSACAIVAGGLNRAKCPNVDGGPWKPTTISKIWSKKRPSLFRQKPNGRGGPRNKRVAIIGALRVVLAMD